jgi:hypothetical protein
VGWTDRFPKYSLALSLFAGGNVNRQEILIELDTEIARLREARHLLTDGKGKAARSPKKAAKRTMSAKGRANIAAAQKERWAKVKKPAKSRAGHTLSPEAKAKISAAQKKRWTLQKKAVKR